LGVCIGAESALLTGTLRTLASEDANTIAGSTPNRILLDSARGIGTSGSFGSRGPMIEAIRSA
jgi:hypothetical protein